MLKKETLRPPLLSLWQEYFCVLAPRYSRQRDRTLDNSKTDLFTAKLEKYEIQLRARRSNASLFVFPYFRACVVRVRMH